MSTEIAVLSIVVWMATLIAAVYVFRAIGFSLRQIGMPLILAVFILVFQYLGFPVLLLELDQYRSSFIKSELYLVLTLVAATACVLLTIIGFAFGKLSLRGSSAYSAGLIWRSIAPGGAMSRAWILVLGAVAIFVLFVYVRTVGFDNLAVTVALGFGGDSASIASARSHVSSEFGPGYHWYRLFMRDVLLLVTLASLAQCFVTRHAWDVIVFSAFFLAAAFSMVMTGEKAPLAQLFLGLGLIYVLVSKRGRISWFSVVIVAVVGGLVLAAQYMLFMGAGNPLDAIARAISRLLTGQLVPAYIYVEYFSQHHDHLLGKSFPNPRGMLPFDHFPIAREVAAYAYPAQAERGVVMSAPTIFWAEAYGNFGWPGVLVIPPLVGFAVVRLDHFFVMACQGPFSLALYVWITLWISELALTGFSAYLFPVNALVIVTLAVCAGYMVIRSRSVLRKGQSVSHLTADSKEMA